MLEIRGLKKVYKAKKGGSEVRALDGVSIRFPEKGMVFLLGKSGSGKSTLLNLCGGLDAPDEGEIIIKGRSSKDFTQADFDSYRNTFIGFVFQEYNILNEFSVEDNIALALELQGKGRDRKQIEEILRQVELTDFAKRKPNTLSGGQKQRVAIARALVKNPEIILADEPTGALDSNTGKQVLDTLKKLSADKLVIVVSHDREFAEVYGDRIIELKDGKVVSDVTKEKLPAEQASDNLTFIGSGTISVKSGARLTPADVDAIQKFLLSSPKDVLISNGQREIADFKKAARIDEEGAQETFADTDEKAIPARTYTQEESRFIRSKLPFRHAARIGASSMRVKPFRLVFTIFLSFIAFAMFGLFSTLTFYDGKSVMLQSYIDAGYETIALQKYFEYDNVTIERATGKELSRYTSEGSACFTPAEVQEYRDRYGAALGLFNFERSHYSTTSFSIQNLRDSGGSALNYYQPYIFHFADGAADYPGPTFVAGESDLSKYGTDDIAISSYLFDSIRNAGLTVMEPNEIGIFVPGAEIPLENYADIVGQTLYLTNGVELNVRGGLRADPDEKCSALQEAAEYADLDYDLARELYSVVSHGLYGAALVSDDFYDAHLQDFADNSWGGSDIPDYAVQLEGELNFTLTSPDYGSADYYINRLMPYTAESAADTAYVYLFKEGKTFLSDKEVLIEATAYMQILDPFLYEVRNTAYNQLVQEMFDAAYQEYYDLHWEGFLEEYRQNNESVYDDLYRNFLDQGYTEAEAAQAAADEIEADARNEFDWQAQDIASAAANEAADEWNNQFEMYHSALYYPGDYGEQTAQEALAFFSPYLAEIVSDEDFVTQITLRNTFGADIGEYTIVGFYASANMYGEALLFSESETENLTDLYGSSTYSMEETKYVRAADEKYNTIILPSPDHAGLADIVYGSDELAEDDTFYTLVSPVADSLSYVNSTVEMLSTVFLWIGVVMAVFAMLLLFNFISVSITYKKREIGILRAVGARSADVFKIFYSESAIITAICYVLAMAASFIVCAVLNAELADFTNVSLFVFGPLSWLVMLGIAIVTSLIATFLPVYGIAKRRPVESIRAL